MTRRQLFTSLAALPVAPALAALPSNVTPVSGYFTVRVLHPDNKNSFFSIWYRSESEVLCMQGGSSSDTEYFILPVSPNVPEEIEQQAVMAMKLYRQYPELPRTFNCKLVGGRMLPVAGLFGMRGEK